jgi:RNA recognition motif-containing protein
MTRKIEIITQDLFSNELDFNSPHQVVRCRGLPYGATGETIRDIFKKYGVNLCQVYLREVNSCGRNARHNGVCYIVFSDTETRDRALDGEQG